MTSSAGFFLSFEGSEGCGKSTQIRLLRERLERAGSQVEVLREPGGTAVGEEIRHLLQHAKAGEGMSSEAELLLFAASRAQIVREKIRPLLEAGAVVILDRFLDSTTVYQGMARGLPLESVRAINAFATGGTLPHLTLVLDMDPALARQRIQASGRPLDRMESQPLAFFEKVRAGYLKLAAEDPQRILLVDAARSPEMIHEEVWTQVQSRSRHAL
ncbi:dTMP kinase [Prosthecobacter debontii]|uniref:Thymidylate kinase n=1 Tax=Prosthecobacter debontii TaxID=48467 RepID=A0A1T4XJ00_9BACT|nr:dTMP kinase [Prosthecobacter debontii]SKA89128.1 dTMP kinase [Prosthecobacter debontii]